MSRAAALSTRLARVHAELRRGLADARDALENPAAEEPTSLVAHCLAFCTALTSHHQGEDGGLFGELVRVDPSVAPVIDKLVEDHQLISGLIQRARSLLPEAHSAPTAQQRLALRRELDGIDAILSSHFAYEERTISKAIDQVVDVSWAPAVFGSKRQGHPA